MSMLQKVIILLNFKPFTYLFGAIYALGLRRLLVALAKHPAVSSVYGCGSYFEGGCLFGLSDIDLIIVIDEKFSRADPEPHGIVTSYNRVRRFFPFLGNWHEKAENLIFLSEIRAGFPLPESFTLRLKQGRLFLLYGEMSLDDVSAGSDIVNEAVAEIDTLIRMSLTKGEITTSNMLFWKRIFLKLVSLAEALGLLELVENMRKRQDLSFLMADDVSLFVRKSDPNELFQLLLEQSANIFKEVLMREEMVSVNFDKADGCLDVQFCEDALAWKEDQSKALSEICRRVGGDPKAIRSPLFGILPRLNYCPIDEHMPVIELEKVGYGALRTIIKTLAKRGEVSESLLVKAGDLLFIISKLMTYVDVVPLDPLIYANIYARLLQRERSFHMPSTIYDRQKKIAGRMLTALAGLYRKNEGWITKLPFPCVYFEDDLVVMRDAFHRMRVFLMHSKGLDLERLDALVRFLGEEHPGCRGFLNDLREYYHSLIGDNGQKGYGNNLYRCLHQFMEQLLSGEPKISIDDHQKRLGITVGVITRNRMADLEDVLHSLTHQLRPADEVLIVDNGSTDRTREVVDGFRDRLPITYDFLQEASIPKARNMVIEKARHEVVAFTDDDCIVEKGWLESVERGFLRADNVGIVGGWVKHEWSAKESVIDSYYSIFHHYKT